MTILTILLAACDPNNPIGCIEPPTGVKPLPVDVNSGIVTLGPIILLLNLVFKLIFIAAGLYAFFQLITAGFGFINAGGDAKQVSAAWNKITQTFLGVIIIVASFLMAAIMGQIFFGNALYFLQPSLILK